MTKVLTAVGLYFLGLGLMFTLNSGAQKTKEYKQAEAVYARTPNIPGQ